jgi:hypothetical protein
LSNRPLARISGCTHWRPVSIVFILCVRGVDSTWLIATEGRIVLHNLCGAVTMILCLYCGGGIAVNVDVPGPLLI